MGVPFWVEQNLRKCDNGTPMFTMAGREGWARVTMIDGRDFRFVMDVGGYARFKGRLYQEVVNQSLFLNWMLPFVEAGRDYHRMDVAAMLFANPAYVYMRIFEYKHGICYCTVHKDAEGAAYGS